MGTLNNPTTQNLGGKVSWIVGYTRLGRYCQRCMPQSVHDPKTPPQMVQRQIVTIIGSLTTSLQGWFKTSFADGRTTGQTALNKAFKEIYAVPNILLGTYPAMYLDLMKMPVQTDTGLLNIQDPNASYDSSTHEITCTWTDNTGLMPDALASDVVNVYLVHRQFDSEILGPGNDTQFAADDRHSFYPLAQIGVAVRSDATMTFTVPTTLRAGMDILYFAVESADGKKKSNTLSVQNAIS